jgi:hypothetical protein
MQGRNPGEKGRRELLSSLRTGPDHHGLVREHVKYLAAFRFRILIIRVGREYRTKVRSNRRTSVCMLEEGDTTGPLPLFRVSDFKVSGSVST